MAKKRKKIVGDVVSKIVVDRYYKKGEKLPYTKLESLALEKAKEGMPTVSKKSLKGIIKENELAQDVMRNELTIEVKRKLRKRKRILINENYVKELEAETGISKGTIIKRLIEMGQLGLIKIEKEEKDAYIVRK